MNKALFLDRDGVININHGYVHLPEQFDFIEGIFDICRLAQERGYLIIVVTNQAGIGRGYYSEETFHGLTVWMKQKFKDENVEITDVYFCPDHPEHGLGHYKRESFFRKPAPGMIFAAAKEHDLILKNCVLVGDKLSDIEAGSTAGVGINVIYSPEGFGLSEVKCINRLEQLDKWL